MKVGFIGAGRISCTMAYAIKQLENKENADRTLQQMRQAGLIEEDGTKLSDIECTAVAARDLGRAKAFAQEYGFRKAYGKYEELLEDPEIDLVYVALPHSLHCEWTIKALEAGKNVLCEKAFAMNAAEAEQMIAKAREKGLLLAEAMWPRYMPSRKIIEKILAEGSIGTVHFLSANLGYPVTQKERIMREDLGGGALLDLVVYPLNFASMYFGNRIGQIKATCVRDASGVDAQDQVNILYSDGRMASIFSTIYTRTDRTGWIYGDRGMLQVENVNNPEKICLYSCDDDGNIGEGKEIAIPDQINGYEYEVVSCAHALQKGQTQCAQMPWEETLEMMRQIDQIRREFA